MQPQLYNPGGQSPFDTIKQVRPDGSEFWSARDLMAPFGYEKWERFEAAIERAKATAENEKMPSHIHFPGAGKMVTLGFGIQREVKDYHLSRYAAYLVIMNGDSRKPQIAAAQTYFTVQTRIAETTKSPAELSRKEILLLALEAEERAEQAEAQVKELAPAAEAYGHWQERDGGMSRREMCQKLREIYPGMNEVRLREHMLKRRELVTKRDSKGNTEYVPGAVAFDRGYARRYGFTDRQGKSRVGYVLTHKYYEELVKRFSTKLAAAGQQEILEVS